jgi:hypothetical protein
MVIVFRKPKMLTDVPQYIVPGKLTGAPRDHRGKKR